MKGLIMFTCLLFGSVGNHCTLPLPMAPSQTVTGFFDNTAEAQQAVQVLLGFGFRADQIAFSTQKGAQMTGSRGALTPQERNSGRFLRSLFGPINEGGSDLAGSDGPDEAVSRSTTTVVIVQVQAPQKVDQAVDLLKGARTVRISQPGA